jgi:uncharacterized Zn finger protein (UPF0148 family)
MNEVSGKLGEKMMTGFTMLSTVCPQQECRGTPLVRKGNAPMQCVSCEKEYHISSLGELVAIGSASPNNSKPASRTATPASSAALTNPPKAPSAPSAVQTTTAAAAATTDSSFFLDMNNAPILSLSSFAQNPDDAASRISKRLMQGWALLDRCCDSAKCRGEVPLMRDLDGKVRNCFIGQSTL